MVDIETKILVAIVLYEQALSLHTVLTRGEYTTHFDVLSGGENRHSNLLDTALLVKAHSEPSRFQAVYPSLNFTCSGVIHRLYMVARESGGSETPSLTLWEKGPMLESPQFKFRVHLTSLNRILHDSETGIGLYEHMMEGGFSSGDMLGFSQPSASNSSIILQYLDKTGDKILINNNISNNVLPFWPSYDNPGSMFPLLTIETSE